MAKARFNLAILGAGSSAAYYLNTLDRNQFPKIAIVGQADPWAGQRGSNFSNTDDPVNIVNQSAHMIEHFGDTVPQRTQTLYPRNDWAESNKKILDQVTHQRFDGRISSVSRYKKDSSLYRIQVVVDGEAVNILAAKVVVATGAGQHKPPTPELERLAQSHPKLFMDMDRFARHPEYRVPGKHIIVQGPNAAVDSVDTAAFNQCHVYWFTGEPALLATKHQDGARAVNRGDGGQKYSLNRNSDPKSIRLLANGKIQVELTNYPNMVIDADHYVWGIGQDDQAAVEFISSELRAELQPIYDKNQRFGAAHQSVLGFELPGTTFAQGFEVVGALSRQMLISTSVAGKPQMKHTYLRDMAAVIAELQVQISFWTPDLEVINHGVLLQPVGEWMKQKTFQDLQTSFATEQAQLACTAPTWTRQVKALTSMMLNYAVAQDYFANHTTVTDADLNNALKITTPSTVGSPQLGSIRTVTQAMHGFVPKYVAPQDGMSDVNFSHDDRTVLRVYIAVNYPLVEENDASAVIEEIISRRRKPEEDPWGYTQTQVNDFNSKLKVLNSKASICLQGAKTIGTGQTVRN